MEKRDIRAKAAYVLFTHDWPVEDVSDALGVTDGVAGQLSSAWQSYIDSGD
jgi:hypothetical protein